MLESIFKGVLNLSLYATVVAVAIMLIKLMCGKRLSPAFHYGIWFVFLLKLVIPFDIKSVFSLFTLFNQVVPVPVLEKVNTVLPPMTTGALINSANHQPPVLTPELAVPAHGLDLWNVAALIWVLGILVMFAVLIFSYIKTARMLKATVEEPDDRRLALLEKCKSDLKMRSQASVYITRSIEIPFIFGFFKPVIILPERIYKNLTDERIIAILSHELMHIKRRDYVVNLILFLLKSVYWFNPVVWLSFAWLKNDGERACDSAVVKNYSTERRREYAGALLDVASCVGKGRPVVVVSAFTEGNLKDRVKNVLTERKYSYIASFAAVAVVIIAGTVLLTGALTKSEDISPGASITETQDECAEAEVISLVENFGKKLQAVSLTAPGDYVNKSIRENYGDLISPELLSAWQKDLQDVPGRVVSSPWPDQIEILSIKKSAESEYDVKGEILEITSVEMLNGGVAARRPIDLSVRKVENRWLITAVQLGAYENTNPKEYQNPQYGFNFSFANAKILPATENIRLPLPASTQQTANNQTDLRTSNSLPASIQSISISDDSPAGSYWSPDSQNAVLAQVSSWFKTAKPYTGTVPNTDYVDDIVHHNIGPSAMHITGSEQFKTLIYPAWYVKIDGQEVDGGSITHNIHYIQDVVVIIEGRTNYISYLESGSLYNWLKNEEWKTEFRQNPALTPLYQTNENGQTYGSAFASNIVGNPQPDLVSAGKDGTSGYVKYKDLMGPQPKTPEEAIAMQEMGKFEKREIPLYAADGKTVIGSFK